MYVNLCIFSNIYYFIRPHRIVYILLFFLICTFIIMNKWHCSDLILQFSAKNLRFSLKFSSVGFRVLRTSHLLFSLNLFDLTLIKILSSPKFINYSFPIYCIFKILQLSSGLVLKYRGYIFNLRI